MLLIIAMLILPLPTFLLDILFTLNIMIALIVIMIAIHTEKPLIFPRFQQFAFRDDATSSLNVASTRIVSVNGHEGTDAAGKVIEAFGKFVIGVLPRWFYHFWYLDDHQLYCRYQRCRPCI